MKTTFKILLTGFIILAGAIILNMLANFLGITTWHEFISQSSIEKQSSQTGILSLIFLFIIYPFTLGLIAYLFLKNMNALDSIKGKVLEACRDDSSQNLHFVAGYVF